MAIKTLKELREENKRLKAKRKIKSEMLKEYLERKRLRKENLMLKYPGTFKALKQVKQIAKTGAKKVGSTTTAVVKRQLEIGAMEARRKQTSLKRKKSRRK